MPSKKERYKFFVEHFSKEMPQADTELQYRNPYELLVAVILSAQCTDKRVNLVTPAFFKRFPDAETLAASSVDEIFSYIKSISYPNNKTKHLQGMASMLLQDFRGKVPEDITDLQKLPGVGRKTANVIASVVYGKAAMAVDTHVFRVAKRIGLTEKKHTLLQTEKELLKYLPEEVVPLAHHWLILHGRYTCTARNPKCNSCKITAWCKYFAAYS